MKRRKFLTIMGLSTAAVALPGVGFLAANTKQAAASIINEKFYYLKLDRDGVHKFVAIYFDRYGETFHLDIKLSAYDMLGEKSVSAWLVTHMTQEYLSSTDFFLNKMDEERTIKYLGMYNPYMTPCANPFSNLFYPSQSNAV